MGDLQVNKIGKVYSRESADQNSWWSSHTMAPAALRLNDEIIRVFLGCWDKQGISRIGYVDVLTSDPTEVVAIAEKPALEIGEDGCFDENGVFPGHVANVGDEVWLYYTGFQLGQKVRHYNFGGLAISRNGGRTFERYSKAPVLDRSDEGLMVRAGQSVIKESHSFYSAYSAGNGWMEVSGEQRPIYDVFFQKSKDGKYFDKTGTRIVKCDLHVEHGLGRPQILKLGDEYYVFYTRRIISGMKYHMGCAKSVDLKTWKRCDSVLADIQHGGPGDFDSEMVYFPCVVPVSKGAGYLFYSGNYFGRDGLGVASLSW